MQIDFSNIGANQKQNWLESAVVPRPIGLISTIDGDGVPNLAPFSFFNIVSTDPAIILFSPQRRLRDNTGTHTVENIREVPEAVIHIVSHANLQQMNLCGCEYPESVDEFVKAGFTKEKATQVKPWMINECAIKIECRIKEMRSMGSQGGAGMICFAEVVCMHVNVAVLNEQNHIDPLKLDPVAMIGTDRYMRVNRSGLVTMPKPGKKIGIGFDGLPDEILNSTVLTANQLGQLALVEKIPVFSESFSHMATFYELERPASEKRTADLHRIAARLLELSLVEDAWQVLLRVSLVQEPTEELYVVDRHD